jgi:hypothetical protein
LAELVEPGGFSLRFLPDGLFELRLQFSNNLEGRYHSLGI